MRIGAVPQPTVPTTTAANLSGLWDGLEFAFHAGIHTSDFRYVLLLGSGYSLFDEEPIAADGRPMDADGAFLTLAIPQEGTPGERMGVMRAAFVRKMAERLG